MSGCGVDETQLYARVLELFPRQSLAFSEVPYFGKRVDLVLTERRISVLHAVEVKLRDWQGALKQAAINQLFAHYSYVALPEWRIRTLGPEQLNAFARYHVGLIAVDEYARIVIPALRNGYFHRAHYKAVKSLLTSRATRGKPKTLGAVTRAIAAGRRTLELLQTRAH